MDSDGSFGVVETLRLGKQAEFGWQAERLGLNGAKVRPRAGESPGWTVEQPLRKPGKWTKWFGISRCGDQAENEAWKCKAAWDAEDARAHLAGERDDVESSSVPLYSLVKARKCDSLEVAVLLSGDFSEGQAECARQQAASKFQPKKQSSMEEDGDSGVRDSEGDTVITSTQ